MNDLIVSKACHKITATGLVKNVAYSYDAYPDRPGVVLHLTITDEVPLLSAVIKPAADESLWLSLQARDPIFTRQLPPTEKALAFYAKGLEACLRANGRSDEYVGAMTTADNAGNPTGIVFEIRLYKGAPSVH